MESWLIPAAPVTVVEEIKKSRFITLLAHTDGVAAAKAFVESVRADHPDARHHCVAWVAGPPDDSQQLGFSDDGEPAGTAGKPMLAQLMGSGVGEITAVVVRYYGGILLGTGGLVKAYGGGVHQALAQLTTLRKTPLTAYTLQCEYGQLAGVEALLAQFSGNVVESEYLASVRLRVELPQAEVAPMGNWPASKRCSPNSPETSLKAHIWRQFGCAWRFPMPKWRLFQQDWLILVVVHCNY